MQDFKRCSGLSLRGLTAKFAWSDMNHGANYQAGMQIQIASNLQKQPFSLKGWYISCILSQQFLQSERGIQTDHRNGNGNGIWVKQ